MTSLQERLAAQKAKNDAEKAANTPPVQSGMASIVSSPDTPIPQGDTSQAETLKDQEKAEAKALQDPKATIPGAVNGDGTPTTLEQAQSAHSKQPPFGQYSEKAFFARRQKQLILANGSRIVPDKNGVFEPKSQEEHDLLVYFESLNRDYVRSVHAEDKEV
ncbi:MAG: hypothetical protein AB7F19_07465 [Candidatus Babeliales bacterium]